MHPKEPLTKDRIIRAAARVADASGLGSVSMRNVARELGVEAMSLYHHLAGKGELLHELAEWVFAQIPPATWEGPWRAAILAHADSMRAVLSRHPWALGLVDAQSEPGPAQLRRYDSVLGALFAGGFDASLAVHAFSAIDSYVFGFVLTEHNLPFETAEATGTEAIAEGLAEGLSGYPNLGRIATDLLGAGDFRFGEEFRIGLDLILDSLADRLRT